MPCYVRRANVVWKVKQRELFPIFSFSFYCRLEHPQFNAKECKRAYLAEQSCNTEKQWPVPLNESLFIRAGRQKWKKKSVKIGKALPNSTGLAVHLWLQKALFKFGLFFPSFSDSSLCWFTVRTNTSFSTYCRVDGVSGHFLPWTTADCSQSMGVHIQKEAFLSV